MPKICKAKVDMCGVSLLSSERFCRVTSLDEDRNLIVWEDSKSTITIGIRNYVDPAKEVYLLFSPEAFVWLTKVIDDYWKISSIPEKRVNSLK